MTLVPLDPDRINNFWYSRGSHATVIVFLHGIFSDSRGCWKNTTHALPVFWPDLVLSDHRFGDPSMYLAGYHTALDAGDFPLAQCARQVFDALRRPEADGTAPAIDAKQLIFVCHSTGGIVARYMLDKYREQFEDKEIGLLLIASPSLGSGWANLAGLAAKYYKQRLGRQLRWNNEELEDLHGRFKDLVDQRASLMPGLYGREAAEHEMVFRDRIPRWLLWATPPSWKVVNTLSAGQYFGAVKILPKTNHFTTVKPDGPNHPGHELLVDFWLDFHRQIDQKAQARSSPVTAAMPVPVVHAEFLNSESFHRHRFAAIHRSDTPTIQVFVYLEIQDLRAFEDEYNEAVKSMSEDPLISAVPELLHTLRKGQIRFHALDVELRARFADLLGTLTFEAYVAFSKAPASPEKLVALMTNLLYVRLRGAESDSVEIELAAESISFESSLIKAVNAASQRVARTDSKPIIVGLKEESKSSPGGIAAQLVADIVLTRLATPQSPTARSFSRIHPAKVRLINDFDTGVYFSRRRPFTGS